MLDRMYTAKNLQTVNTLVYPYTEKNNIAILHVKEVPITYNAREERQIETKNQRNTQFCSSDGFSHVQRVKVD